MPELFLVSHNDLLAPKSNKSTSSSLGNTGESLLTKLFIEYLNFC